MARARSSENKIDRLPLLTWEEVAIATDHFFRLVPHPFVYHPLIDTCRGTIRGEAVGGTDTGDARRSP
jgi:hypothetical protein